MSNIKIDKRSIRSKKALKEAMVSLMQMKEFKEITVTDIVIAADVNRSTFYKHYQFKEELLNDIIDDVLNDLIESYLEPYKNKDHLEISQLTSNGIKLFEHVQNYSNFYTLIIQSNGLFNVQQRVCEVLKNLTLKEFARHTSNPHFDEELISSFYSYAIFGMIVEWINGGFKYSSNYMAEQLLKIINTDHGTIQTILIKKS